MDSASEIDCTMMNLVEERQALTASSRDGGMNVKLFSLECIHLQILKHSINFKIIYYQINNWTSLILEIKFYLFSLMLPL